MDILNTSCETILSLFNYMRRDYGDLIKSFLLLSVALQVFEPSTNGGCLTKSAITFVLFEMV